MEGSTRVLTRLFKLSAVDLFLVFVSGVELCMSEFVKEREDGTRTLAEES